MLEESRPRPRPRLSSVSPGTPGALTADPGLASSPPSHSLGGLVCEVGTARWGREISTAARVTAGTSAPTPPPSRPLGQPVVPPGTLGEGRPAPSPAGQLETLDLRARPFLSSSPLLSLAPGGALPVLSPENQTKTVPLLTLKAGGTNP